MTLSADSADVVVIDYGMSNTNSLVNMVKRIGHTAEVSDDPDVIKNASRLLLPGVGAFDEAMKGLEARGLVVPIQNACRQGTPLLGVCLGMQLLLDGSEEGQLEGLGVIPGNCRRFPAEIDSTRLIVPHMGWNTVLARGASRLLPSLGSPESRYYFVHSFYAKPDDDEHILGETTYGLRFASAIQRENVIGLQFHPEKSHRHGMALIRDFVKTRIDSERQA